MVAVPGNRYGGQHNDEGITPEAAQTLSGVSPAQITRLKRNESVSTHTIEVFCRILSCRVEDVMTFIPDAEE